MAKLRVLIADDDDEMRQNMVVLLSKDYQVIGAVTSRELIQVATCMLPDVIVSDISAPRMDGLEARKQLIVDGKFIPFVFVFRERQEVISVFWKESSFAFVCTDEVSMHLINVVEAVHDATQYHSSFLSKFIDQQPEDQNIVLIEEGTLRKAEQMIQSCERCNAEAQLFFCEILDRLTGSDPSVTDYILKRPGACPRCFRPVTETTLVESAVTETTLVESDDRG